MPGVADIITNAVEESFSFVFSVAVLAIIFSTPVAVPVFVKIPVLVVPVLIAIV